MIVNLPTSEGLRTTALKLYFEAWSSLVGVLADFDGRVPGGGFLSSPPDPDWADDRRGYLELCQEDLQAILAIQQQSNELALKARIAAVSPYLLLLNADVNLSTTARAIDFSTLRTLDAVELPGAVISLCPDAVSDDYIRRYNARRVLRNQYAHLGNANVALDPLSMLADLVEQYLELWPDRAWLSDRVAFARYEREEFFGEKNSSRVSGILYGLDSDKTVIPNRRFKDLFGVPKGAVKFLCHRCCADDAVRRWGFDAKTATTAHYVAATETMHCLMCGSIAEVDRLRCRRPACASKFRAPATVEYGAETCFVCGDDRTVLDETDSSRSGDSGQTRDQDIDLDDHIGRRRIPDVLG